MVHVNDAAFINEKTIARHDVFKLGISYSAPNAIQKKILYTQHSKFVCQHDIFIWCAFDRASSL